MTTPKHISSSGEFEKAISAHKIVVTDFYADWCGPCKAIAPVFESLCASESKPGKVLFCKVDVDSQREIASKYSVTAMPTFIIFQNGSVKNTIRGANPGALRTSVKAAINSAGAGGSAAFESKGQVLGSGSDSTARARPSYSSASADVSLAELVPGGFLGAIVRFFGLYFQTLFTLDPKGAAEHSPFRVSGTQGRFQKRS